MGKESGTQFLKALKDAIGESAIDGEARRGVEREQEARIEADNELQTEIDKVAESGVKYIDLEVSVPETITTNYCRTLSGEYPGDIVYHGTVNNPTGDFTVSISMPDGVPVSPLAEANLIRLEWNDIDGAYEWVSHPDYIPGVVNFNEGNLSVEVRKDSEWSENDFYIFITNCGQKAVDLEASARLSADAAIERAYKAADSKLEDALGDKADIKRASTQMKGIMSFAIARCAVYQYNEYYFSADGTICVYVSEYTPEGTQWSLTVEPQWVNVCQYASLKYLDDEGLLAGDFDDYDMSDPNSWTFSATTPAALAKGNRIVIVPMAQLPENMVGTDELDTRAVDTENLEYSAVDTDRIADKAVTAAKIANNAVGTDQLGYGVVTKAKMAEASVGTEELSDGCVTKAKLSNSLGFVATPSTSVSLKANESKTVALATNATITDGSWAHIVNTYGLDDATTASVAFGTYAVGSTRVTVHVANNTDSAISFNIRVFFLKDTLFD